MEIALTALGGEADAPLLVLGPSLGTSVAQLWGPVVPLVADRFRILGWDLPGHGSTADGDAPFGCGDLAAAVARRVGEPFHYAGVSIGGAVGLHLLLDAPDRVRSAMLLETGAKILTAESWRDRIAMVRAAGSLDVMVDGSRQRWFAAAGRAAGEPMLATLRTVGVGGYTAACEALATHDVRRRLGEIAAPVLAVAGAEDLATPPADLQAIADGVPDGRLVVLPDVAHLAPWEAPRAVADLLLSWTLARD